MNRFGIEWCFQFFLNSITYRVISDGRHVTTGYNLSDVMLMSVIQFPIQSLTLFSERSFALTKKIENSV